MVKRTFTATIILIILMMAWSAQAWAAPDYSVPPNIEARSAVLIDANTGEILFAKNKDERLPMASLTKIMTALIVLETYDPTDVVVIDNNTQSGADARFILKKGEKYTIDTLLYALMLVSSNESATALASAGTSEEAFIARMNERAQNIGAKDTHFVTPHGLPEEGHYSTAHDMALIAREAMKNENFRKYVGTNEAKVNATTLQKARTIVNSNRLLNDSKANVMVYGKSRAIAYKGTIGIKTGHTEEAGTCLAADVKKNSEELISVVMNGDTNLAYQDTINLFEYGFNNFKAVSIFKSGTTQESMPVAGGKQRFVDAVITENIKGAIPNGASASAIEIKVDSAGEIQAPVTKGAIIGTAVAYYKGKKLCETPLKAGASVEKSLFNAGGFVSALIKIVLIAAAILFLIIVVALIRSSLLRRRGSFSGRSKNDFTSRQVSRIKRLR